MLMKPAISVPLEIFFHVIYDSRIVVSIRYQKYTLVNWQLNEGSH